MSKITIEKLERRHLAEAAEIWNEVVKDGMAFPQENVLEDDAWEFFSSQSFTGIALENDSVKGLYILHPNNVGRCSHIANASYAVKKDFRNTHIGEKLVVHSLKRAKDMGFRVMQFNAVVKSNEPAHHLYAKLGFTKLGTIPGGFRNISGEYEDIISYIHEL